MTKISNQYSLTNILTADLANSRLGINNVSPTVAFDVTGVAKFSSSGTFGGLVSGGNSSPSTSYNAGSWFTGDGLVAGNISSVCGIQINSSTTSTLSAIRFGDGDGVNNLYDQGSIIYNHSLDRLGFSTNRNTAMVITSAGLVGIGTTSPSTELHIKAASSYAEVRIDGASGGGASLEYYSNGTQLGDIYCDPSYNMIFRNNGATERMRITSTGVLGLGVVPKSWYTSGIAVMQFATGGALWGFGASNILLSANEYFDTSGTPRYIDADAATRYQHNAGYHRFSTAPVGTAGAAMTITERLRIHNNGNVTISDTGTDNGYKLFVNGTSAGTSAFQNVSDRRLKKDITLIESALNKVKLLNGVSFNWDKTLRPDLALDDKNHLGLIAQDVEEILPQVVTTGIDELKTKTIAYSDIVPVLIEAIKELSAEINLLKQK
jgi:hypothetical protein